MVSKGYTTTYQDNVMYGRCLPLPSAYFAGVLDGEGCIRLGLHVQKGRESFEPVVKVVMTSRGVLEAFAWKYGGRVREQNNSVQNRKQAYIWRIGSRLAVKEFLMDVIPWLIEKRAQATTLIEYLDDIARDGSDSVDSKAVSAKLTRLKKAA